MKLFSMTQTGVQNVICFCAHSIELCTFVGNVAFHPSPFFYCIARKIISFASIQPSCLPPMPSHKSNQCHFFCNIHDFANFCFFFPKAKQAATLCLDLRLCLMLFCFKLATADSSPREGNKKNKKTVPHFIWRIFFFIILELHDHTEVQRLVA